MLDAKSPKMTSKAEVIPRCKIFEISSRKIILDFSQLRSIQQQRNHRLDRILVRRFLELTCYRISSLDQLTTNVPQGAKPSEKKAKQLPVNTDEDVYQKKLDQTSEKFPL